MTLRIPVTQRAELITRTKLLLWFHFIYMKQSPFHQQTKQKRRTVQATKTKNTFVPALEILQKQPFFKFPPWILGKFQTCNERWLTYNVKCVINLNWHNPACQPHIWPSLLWSSLPYFMAAKMRTLIAGYNALLCVLLITRYHQQVIRLPLNLLYIFLVQLKHFIIAYQTPCRPPILLKDALTECFSPEIRWLKVAQLASLPQRHQSTDLSRVFDKIRRLQSCMDGFMRVYATRNNGQHTSRARTMMAGPYFIHVEK